MNIHSHIAIEFIILHITQGTRIVVIVNYKTKCSHLTCNLSSLFNRGYISYWQIELTVATPGAMGRPPFFPN